MAILELESLQVSIGGRKICHQLDLQLEPGQMLGMLGRNGIGKTTMLYTIMGFLPPEGGTIRLSGIELKAMSRRQLARKLGMLFQENHSSMPVTVLETVLLGRHPYSENLMWDAPADINIARSVLRLVGLEALESRQVATLSGGERQRLALASLLAQEPEIYLLDEPSNHLDIDYQSSILRLLRDRISRQQASIIMASHDINLVSRFCDRVMLFLDSDAIVEGPTEEVLNIENLQRAFGCKVLAAEIGGQRYFLPA